jgi:hypothetical protein
MKIRLHSVKKDIQREIDIARSASARFGNYLAL